MTNPAATLLSPFSDRSPDELGELIDDAITAGRRVGEVASEIVDHATSPTSPKEWVGVGQSVALVLPPALKALQALAKAFGLDEAFKRWLAKAPERQAKRAARRAARKVDTDRDGVPDWRDRDDDNDGVVDRKDVAPKDPYVANILHD